MFSPEEIEKTRQLLELFGSNQLSELSIAESGGYSIEIVAGVPEEIVVTPAFVPTAPTHVSRPSQSTAIIKQAEPADKSNFKSLNSPMVGIFYAAGAPGDPPFVNVGDVVAVGQTIGLIEAMKVFSEIPAEISGRIVEIVGVTGTLVQQSEPLFRIEPV